MDRWFIILFTMALFLGLAVIGWRYRRATQPVMAMCTSADAQCGDRPYLGSP
jgi:hypothetical protein